MHTVYVKAITILSLIYFQKKPGPSPQVTWIQFPNCQCSLYTLVSWKIWALLLQILILVLGDKFQLSSLPLSSQRPFGRSSVVAKDFQISRLMVCVVFYASCLMFVRFAENYLLTPTILWNWLSYKKSF